MLHVLTSKEYPFVVPTTNGFLVTPYPGMTLTEATLIRQGILPERWRRAQARHVAPEELQQFFKDHEALAFPKDWEAAKFGHNDELSKAFAQFSGVYHTELCCAHYASKASALIRAANKPDVVPGARLESTYVELYIDFLQRTYGNTASEAIVAEIRRDGVASVVTLVSLAGWESYEDWKSRNVGAKRNDPFKAMATRLLARRRH